MDRTAKFVTLVVLAHLLVSIVHGIAHGRVPVDISLAQSAFIMAVIVVCPLIAMALTWASRRRAGLVLLTLSMFASLLFGLYYHFIAPGPDHVGTQPPGPWGTTFIVTAWLVLLTEAVGSYTGIYLLTRHTGAAK
jgi:hypothetical protein